MIEPRLKTGALCCSRDSRAIYLYLVVGGVKVDDQGDTPALIVEACALDGHVAAFDQHGEALRAWTESVVLA